MGFLNRLLGRDQDASGVKVRPESVRALLVLVEDGEPEPQGDGMEYVMRAFLGRNRLMFQALMERDLWPAVQIGRAVVPAAERDDPVQLAARIERSHGPGLLGLLQNVTGPDGAELTLMTVHGAVGGEPEAERFARIESAIQPRLDLTDPAAERAR